MKQVIYTCDVCESTSAFPMSRLDIKIMHGGLCVMDTDLKHEHVCNECVGVIKRNITSAIDDAIDERIEQEK